MIFLEELYSELSKEKRLPPISKENKTSAFYIFNANLGIGLVLPTLRYGPDSDNDWGGRDLVALRKLSIAQIITSLETYYGTIFRIITENMNILDVDLKILVNFIEARRIKNEFLTMIKKKGNFSFSLSEIMSKNFSFQSSKFIEISMNLIDLDPVGKFKKEWIITFGKKENSTVSLRHSYIHEGFPLSGSGLSFEEIKERIKNAILLIAFLESQIINKYSFKDLYPQKVDGA